MKKKMRRITMQERLTLRKACCSMTDVKTGPFTFGGQFDPCKRGSTSTTKFICLSGRTDNTYQYVFYYVIVELFQ